MGDWLRGPLGPMVDDTVGGERLAARGVFKREKLQALLDDHRARRADHGHRLWNLMVLELWLRQFADGNAFLRPGPA